MLRFLLLFYIFLLLLLSLHQKFLWLIWFWCFNLCEGGGENGHGSAIITTLTQFDREKQKEYYMPVIMRDSGSPSVTGTNTLTIIIGDVNDNVHHAGHKDIHVYNYKGRFHMLSGRVTCQCDELFIIVEL